MAIHEKNRAVRFYHAAVALVILLSGVALLGLGIWLQSTDNAGALNLEYTSSNVFDFVRNFSVASMVIGAFLIATAIASLISLARSCVGKTFRIIYVLMALVILAALLFICAVSIVILTKRDDREVKNFLSDAWDKTVSEAPQEICNIESRYECRGFNNDDCTGCVLGSEAVCASLGCAVCEVNVDASVGCYDKILGSIRRVYLPTAIVSAILAAVVLVDILVTCAL